MPIIRTGKIHFYAQSDVTCYVIRGKQGDLLVDTGLPNTWRGMSNWLKNYDVRWVFLTHAHVDHDWNAAKLQKAGAKLLLSEYDRPLRRNYLSQPVQPTSPRYRLRNYTQLIGGALLRSPAYDADVYLQDNDCDVLRKLGFDADIVPLPGHTYGSLGILSDSVLYCGDAFTALWHRPDITPHAVSPELMRESLRYIMKLNPAWLACGHGIPVRMRDAKPVIGDYLRGSV